MIKNHFKLLSIFVLFILLVPFSPTSQVVSSQPTQPNPLEPTVNLTLNHDTQTAIPHYNNKEHPAGTLYATFTGEVHVDINEAARIIVDLRVSDTWNNAEVSPTSILFDISGEKPFSVSVRVPPNEKYNSEGSFTIYSFWSVYPSGLSGQGESVVGKVIVGQFCNFTLNTRNEQVDAVIGSETKFEFQIRNEGNHRDSFQIRFKDLDEIERKKLGLRVEPKMVEISKGLSETITVYVTPQKDSDLLIHELKIEVSSINGTPKGLQPRTIKFGLSIEEEESAFGENLLYFGILIVVLIIIIIIIFIIRKRRKNSQYL